MSMDRSEWLCLLGGLVIAAGVAAGAGWALLAQAAWQVCGSSAGPYVPACEWVVPLQAGLGPLALAGVVSGVWLLRAGVRAGRLADEMAFTEWPDW
jgi:hypothetical protein